MGASVSKLVESPTLFTANEPLARFVSTECLPASLPVWNTLLSQPSPLAHSRHDWQRLETVAEDALKRLAVNNLKTGNLSTLVHIWLERRAELTSAVATRSTVYIRQCENALFIVLFVLKGWVERLKEEDFLRQLDPPTQAVEGVESRGELYPALIDSLVDVLCHIPVDPLTYSLHVQCVTGLIFLLASTVVSPKPPAQVRSLRAFLTSQQATLLTGTLLRRFTDMLPAPAEFFTPDEVGGGSLVLGLASGMWNILTLGYNSGASSEGDDVSTGVSQSPLADRGLLMLLLLANHGPENQHVQNPYRDALFACVNVGTGENEPVSEGPETASFTLDFGSLFETLHRSMHSEESTLLLYLLLHRNPHFRTYVLASSDIEALVIPLLKTLYFAKQTSNHHIYMALIVLLILSEDDLFTTSVHDVTLKNIDWYAERSLSEISLGGIAILVIIRTIQYNMLKMRDKYLHSNCLAALANMSGQFKNLHPYVSQRLISMFESLARKHSRLIGTLHNVGELEGLAEDSPLNEALADVSALEEVLRMILEIVNSCLFHQIKANSNLIYALLYKKEVFHPFLSHPNFQDICQNIQLIISFFQSRLDLAQEKKDRVLSVSEVQDVIRETAFGFPKEKLTRFPDLKFKYVEEEQPEDFFVPYLWNLATKQLYWNTKYMPMMIAEAEPTH